MKIYCRVKIRNIEVTATNLDYEGSLEIDSEILEKAGIMPGELVQVVNLSNGARFFTYIIAGERGKRECKLQGGAARLGEVGDKLLVMAFEIGERPRPPTVISLVAGNQFA